MFYWPRRSLNGAETEASAESLSQQGSTYLSSCISSGPLLSASTPISSSRSAFTSNPSSDEPFLDSFSQPGTPKKYFHVTHAYGIYVLPAVLDALRWCSVGVLDTLNSLYFSEI